MYGVYILLGICCYHEYNKKNNNADSGNIPKTNRKSATRPIKHKLLQITWSAGSLLLPVAIYAINVKFLEHDIANQRNFYGILSVKELNVNGLRSRHLVDGTTIHGIQLLDPDKQHIPMSYYRANTGGALAIQNIENSVGLNVGVIGLGAGTLAAYGKNGDTFKFYEINPAVGEMAKNYFSYLKNSSAEVEIILGDARLSLTRALKNNGSMGFHVLVVDAFSSDAIPIHLLTKEAFSLYWDHLLPEGILAIHIPKAFEI